MSTVANSSLTIPGPGYLYVFYGWERSNAGADGVVLVPVPGSNLKALMLLNPDYSNLHVYVSGNTKTVMFSYVGTFRDICYHGNVIQDYREVFCSNLLQRGITFDDFEKIFSEILSDNILNNMDRIHVFYDNEHTVLLISDVR
jgi:hypothetical protein